VTFDKTQVLIRVTALCQMLLAELERLGEEAFASDEFIVELRELCERGRAELASRGTGGG
jgi:hypothetical protein